MLLTKLYPCLIQDRQIEPYKEPLLVKHSLWFRRSMLINYWQSFKRQIKYACETFNLLEFTIFYWFVVAVINTIVVRKTDCFTPKILCSCRFVNAPNYPTRGLFVKNTLNPCVVVEWHWFNYSNWVLIRFTPT
jgi:hypothetical protein